MMPTEIGSAIAERLLHCDDPDEGHRVIRVLLGAPQQSKEPPSDWYCPWQIVGLGDEKVRAAYGVDAIQALQLVMRMIGAKLHAQTAHGVRLWWLEESSSDLGFPCE